MFESVDSEYRVPFDGSFAQAKAATQPPENRPSKKTCKSLLKARIKELDGLQRILFAHDYHAVLLVFQAMDAAGKDGTIRAVLRGINPAGCQVFSFKQPSQKELDHDFLWRTTRCLPERGRIGVFNRSYYEEVLVVRVHPSYLNAQKLEESPSLEAIWDGRYQSIRDHELHLARSGTLILKFWLNVSAEEQGKRFLSRLDEPQKNWKFSATDVKERKHWSAYMEAYEKALNETSRPWAPWYAIPADNKRYMRFVVADIIVRSLKSLKLTYPTVDDRERGRFDEMRDLLLKEQND